MFLVFQVTDEDVPVILVGGGSILLDEKRDFRGSSDVKKPPHYDVRLFCACVCVASEVVDFFFS